MQEPVLFAVMAAASAAMAVLGALQLAGKGPLLNNAYIYASDSERRKMTPEEKRPYYIQSAVCFFIISAVFLLNAVSAWTGNRIFSHISIALCFCAVAYAIASAVVIEKRRRKNREDVGSER